MPAVKEDPEGIKRSSAVLSRDTFKLIFRLNQLQPWLEEKQEALEALLFISNDVNHFDLIVSLTSRFLHIDAGKQKAAIKEIAGQISENWKCKPTNSFITSTNRSDFSDSSENILWLLKPLMSKIGGWGTTSFYSRLAPVTEQICDGANIIIVDEFIGSGSTVEKLVNWIRSKLDERGVKCNIFIGVLAAMKCSKERLDKLGVEYFAVHWLDRGISDYYPSEKILRTCGYMKELESLLAQKCNNFRLSKYSFGYKKSEALYCRDGGNACNNVFPIFWWPELASGDLRQTLLDRLQ